METRQHVLADSHCSDSSALIVTALIITIGHTNPFTFEAIRRSALAVGTENFFGLCCLSVLEIRTGLGLVCFGLAVQGHRG